MAQSDYANSFIGNLLNWLRYLGNRAVATFQTGSGSGGGGWIGWIADNWIKLLIVLIVAGVLIDWIVWMLRWRPYWAWFGKKRVVIDDSEDEDFYDEFESEPVAKPRFDSKARHRDKRREDGEFRYPENSLRDEFDGDEDFFSAEAGPGDDLIDENEDPFTPSEDDFDEFDDGLFEEDEEYDEYGDEEYDEYDDTEYDEAEEDGASPYARPADDKRDEPEKLSFEAAREIAPEEWEKMSRKERRRVLEAKEREHGEQ